MKWQARWIWAQPSDAPQTTLLTRREFRMKAVPKTATLRVSANNIYRLWLNGRLVGRGPDRADPRFPYFDAYEVAPFLKRGANTLRCELHHVQPEHADRVWCLYGGRGGFLLQLDAAGRTQVATKAGWAIAPAPGWAVHDERITRFVSFKHKVDLGAKGEPAWTDAVQVDLPMPMPAEQPRLVRTERAPVHVGAIHPRYSSVRNTRYGIPGDPENVLTVDPAPEGAWVTLDFGRPMGGFPALAFESSAGGEVDVYCAEGELAVMTDRLTLPVAGRTEFEPLDWRGARFLKLHFRGLGGPVKVLGAKFVEMVYPFEARGDFRCSDDTLTKLWRVCRETAWAATKDHPVDCVNREQALWIEDLFVHARSIAACFGDVRPAVKGMRQAFRVMHDDGVVPVPGPVGIGYRRTAQILPWSEQPLTLSMTLRDLYRHTGDAALLRDVFPKVAKLYEHFARYEDRRGLIRSNPPGLPELDLFGGWNFFAKSGVTCAFNFEYALSLDCAAEIARAVGRRKEAELWRAKADRVRCAARRLFWDPTRKLFIDGETRGKLDGAVSPTANAWAALGGGLDPADAGSWAEALRNDAGILPPVSPYDATLLLEAFAAVGLDLHARELLDTYFGSVVRAGQPTMPEFWMAADNSPARCRDDFSRCHPYGTGPAHFAVSHILGARPLTPGWRRTRIEPHAMGLSWASGRVPTPMGDLGIAWEREDARWRLELDLPRGLTAELLLRRFGWGAEQVLIDGRAVCRSERFPDLRRQWRRELIAPAPRTWECTVQTAGRHEIILESCG